MKYVLALLLCLFSAGLYGDLKELFEKTEIKPEKFLYDKNEDVKVTFTCPAELLKEQGNMNISCKIVFNNEVLAGYTIKYSESVKWNTKDSKKGEYKIEITSGKDLKKEEYFYIYPSHENKLKEIYGRAVNLEISKDLMAKPIVPNIYVRLENLDNLWVESAKTKTAANHFMARACEAEEIVAELERDGDYFYKKKGGFVRAYRSEDDGGYYPYHITIPEDYGGADKYPLIVYLHGTSRGITKDKWMDWALFYGYNQFKPRQGILEKFIEVSPYGRGNSGYEGLGEKDVLEVINDAVKNYFVDKDRIYIKGHSMGAFGGVMLGMHYPDIFAAGAFMSGGIRNNIWLENGMHLPSYFVHGKQDTTVDHKESIKMNEKMQDLGYCSILTILPKVGHMGFPKDLSSNIAEFFIKYKKEDYPKSLVFTTNTLNYNKSFWFELCSFKKLNEFAKIKTWVLDNSINFELSNVEDFKITLSDLLIDTKKEITVKINGKSTPLNKISKGKTIRFREINNVWLQVDDIELPGLYKKKGLCGPFQDAFSSGYIIVYGTGGSKEMAVADKASAEAMKNELKARCDGDYLVIPDSEVTQEHINKYNLVLFGDPVSNSVTAKINGSLPIKFKNGVIIFGEKEIKGGNSAVKFIYPNPLNPKKYVVLNIGNRANNEQTPRGMRIPDYQITSDDINISGFFGKNWEIDKELQSSKTK